MANSRRFNQLKRRLAKIEETYLPNIRPTGNYTKKELDFTRAYLLLAHAEIEAYFEEIAENKAKKSFQKWRINRTKSNVLLALVSFHESKINENSLEDRVNKALSTFIHKLRQNHGIKEDNILAMLLPVGIEITDLDSTWLSTISSFGSNRGEIAHTSARVQQPLDPATLKTTVTQIMSEITILDDKVRGLR